MQEEITSGEFVRRLFDSNHIQDITVRAIVVIDDLSTPRTQNPRINKTLVNCIIDELEFKHQDIVYLAFKDCEITKLTINVLNYVYSLDFQGCDIEELIITNDILLSKGTSNKLDLITIANSDIHSIEIDTNEINELKITNGKIYNLSVSTERESESNIRKLFIDSVDLFTLNLAGYKIRDTKIQKLKQCSIQWTSIDADLIEIDCLATSVFLFKESFAKKLFLRFNSNAKLNLANSEVSSFIIVESTFDKILIHGKSTYSIGNYPTNISKRKAKLIKCKRLHINKVTTSEKLSLSNFELQDLIISQLQNNDLFQIHNCIIKNKLSIRNSLMGKTILNNVDISKNKFSFIDSNLEDTTFSNFKWHNNYSLDEEWLGIKHSSFQHFQISLREAYRQLKNNYSKNGNNIEALEFQKHEMRIHYDIVKNTQEKKCWHNDRLILYASTTNDFGMNWKKPIYFILVITTIFYFPMIIFASNKLQLWPASSCEEVTTTFTEFCDYKYIWPQLFNVARNTKHMFNHPDDVTLGFGFHVLDGFHRILLAFFIVQIVSAFRKYVKS
jgi:hypothetical protein